MSDNRTQDSREQLKLKQRLADQLKEPGNKYCSECDSRQPRWSSTNLGVFMCLRCSGIHRNLGVHISKVKSVSLDSWTQEQVDFMGTMGNEKANAVWEYSLPPNSRPKEGDGAFIVESFIRNKYEHKKWKKPENAATKGGAAAAAGSKTPGKSSKKQESSEEESSDEEEREKERAARRAKRAAKRKAEEAAKQMSALKISEAPKAAAPAAAPAKVAAPAKSLIDFDSLGSSGTDFDAFEPFKSAGPAQSSLSGFFNESAAPPQSSPTSAASSSSASAAALRVSTASPTSPTTPGGGSSSASAGAGGSTLDSLLLTPGGVAKPTGPATKDILAMFNAPQQSPLHGMPGMHTGMGMGGMGYGQQQQQQMYAAPGLYNPALARQTTYPPMGAYGGQGGGYGGYGMQAGGYGMQAGAYPSLGGAPAGGAMGMGGGMGGMAYGGGWGVPSAQPAAAAAAPRAAPVAASTGGKSSDLSFLF